MQNGIVPQMLEYLHARGKQLGLPVAGTFELTARCNFHCKMCYVHLTEEEQRRRGPELTAAEWIDIGRQAKEAGMMMLLLTGGEPTLRSDFPEIYRALHRMGFMISINSNGYLLTDRFVELFREETPTRINISLYGTDDATYRALCGISGYERILGNIKALRNAGIAVKLNLSLTPDNMGQMEQILTKAEELGVKVQASPYMFPPVRVDPERVGSNYRMEPEQAGEFQAKFNLLTMTRSEFCKLATRMIKGLSEEATDPCEGSPGRGMECRGGSSSFWLTWDGKMMPCGQMTNPAFDVRALGFAKAWQETRAATAAIRLPKECAGCTMQHLCHACAAMCSTETGRFDGKPEYICRLNQSYYQKTQELWLEAYGGAEQ